MVHLLLPGHPHFRHPVRLIRRWINLTHLLVPEERIAFQELLNLSQDLLPGRLEKSSQGYRLNPFVEKGLSRPLLLCRGKNRSSLHLRWPRNRRHRLCLKPRKPLNHLKQEKKIRLKRYLSRRRLKRAW